MTDAVCKNAKYPEGKPRERYSDSGGRYVEVTANDSKLWRWKYRYGSKEKRRVFSIYPQVLLLEARKARERGKDLLATGSELLRQIESYPSTPIRVRCASQMWMKSSADGLSVVIRSLHRLPGADCGQRCAVWKVIA